METMSVVTSVVVASIRLDGTAASSSHRSLVSAVGAASPGSAIAGRFGLTAGLAGGGAFLTAFPHVTINTIISTKPAAQSHACSTNRKFGSTTNGYATSASKLPQLLAA